MRTAGVADGRVVGLLAGHLLASPWFRCPGVDGASAGDVVAAEYPPAAAAGWVPSPSELAARHPDLAAALGAYFGSATPSGMAG
ncbi:hypothetical protein J0H58_27270 [bacterium]|nr:hypothetical protein [bacterium]